uniref:transmembrane protein 214-like n=1 Tax=Erigeron canadensis TaxID=72917 RepID=UPI001CB9B0E4|nr:transmembrane protein 214-like [Erigeron canadensis]
MDSESIINNNTATTAEEINNNHGWQKVTYAKKQRKNNQNKPQQAPAKPYANGSSISAVDNVFTSIEKRSEERRKLIEANSSIYDPVVVPAKKNNNKKKNNNYSDYDDSSDDEAVANGAVVVEEKKVKPKKVKKPKVTVTEAAAKIDESDLASFLSEVTASFETQQDIQLMRFADYFGRAFSSVNASQFPWVKLLRESAVAKVADNPVSHISEPVYKTSVDWINNRSLEALGSFVLWSLDSILADFASQQGSTKGSKKGAQKTSSKSQVGIFVALAMVLRRKPDALISVLPTLRETSKYQGQDKLPILVWMVAQASQGDLAVGLYCWSHLILPIVGGKSGSNPQTRDLILQLVERILSAPKARTILVNGAVRKGERLMPPSALDLLLRVTFPSSSSRVKATERFEAVYPVLKEVALAGSPGSKAMKQVSQQIMTVSLKAAGEGIPELSREAADISIWCLTQNPDSYKQWEKVYEDNLAASVVILKRLAEQWNELSAKQSSPKTLSETLQSFKSMNEKALTEEDTSPGQQTLYKEADKHCKVLLGKLSRRWGCVRGLGVALVVACVGIYSWSAIATLSDSLDLTKLSEMDWTKLSKMDWTKLSEILHFPQSV